MKVPDHKMTNRGTYQTVGRTSASFYVRLPWRCTASAAAAIASGVPSPSSAVLIALVRTEVKSMSTLAGGPILASVSPRLLSQLTPNCHSSRDLDGEVFGEGRQVP